MIQNYPCKQTQWIGHVLNGDSHTNLMEHQTAIHAHHAQEESF